jgi:hypothetical protein
LQRAHAELRHECGDRDQPADGTALSQQGEYAGLENLGPLMPSATMPTTVATGMRRFLMMGTPPMRLGSMVMRVNSMWIGNWSVRTWAVVTASIYQVLDYTVDSGTLAYLVAISVAAAGLCSLAPIGKVVQLGVNGALQGDARGVTQGRRGKRLAAALVAGQMALAMVLLSGAGILVRSFVKIVGAETGVRMAIGAAAKDIRRMVLRDGMLPVAIGMILGLAAALAVNRILQSQLVGVSPYDPATMGGAPVVLIVVALLACEIAARRAMHVDPAVALRHE